MKPSKLMRHHKTKHNETVSKSIEFFRRKRDQMKQQQRMFAKVAKTNPAALKESTAIDLRIVKSI
jgi:hypothetical protein